MDDDDFEAWSLCWEVNQKFCVKRKHPSSYSCVCIGCNKRADTWSSKYRSEFPALAVRCPQGHSEWMKSTEGDICAICNQEFALKVSSRRQFCIMDGCRRLLAVDEDVIHNRIGPKNELLGKYLSFLEKKKVFECIMCGDVQQLRDAPVLRLTKCNHDPNICTADLARLLEEVINRGQLTEVQCPDTECRAAISPRDVGRFVSPEAFEKYNERLTLESISSDPNFRWCQGTLNGRPCSNGQFHFGGAESPSWICNLCDNTNCFNCHPSVCQKHIDMEDKASMDAIREMSKVCPKRGCGRHLMRSAGCAHMTCKKMNGTGCGTEFCWSCKVIWLDSNKPVHTQSCRWRVDTPIVSPLSSDTVYAPGWNYDPGYDTKYDEGLWMPGMYCRRGTARWA